jgi:DNA-3-methyladenine glycosylase I
VTGVPAEESPAAPAGIVVGDDGIPRCAWSAKDPEYRRYHDEEWGTPLHGDRELFEKLSLEGFQAGLSWITILRRRQAFRDAFAGFDIDKVATFADDDIERLLGNPLIIRNRPKILATIGNARIVRDIVVDAPGAFDAFLWGFAPPRPTHPVPRTPGTVPASTVESTVLSRALHGRGFRFVGPTTAYALMQSVGMVDDHMAGCWKDRCC